MTDPAEQAERRYRRGAELWGQRDLEQAVLVLDEARRISEPAPEQPWLGAITRALAQIALERDDPDTAERHLQRVPDDPVGRLQHQALRARAALLRGDGSAAAQLLSVAVADLAGALPPDDVGTLMNAAIGMAWAADVLVELRDATAAARVAGLGADLVARAGVHDPVVSSMLALTQARAAGLAGDLTGSEAHLGRVDRSADPDLDLQWTAEQARLAWRRGDPAAATAQYDAAIAAAEQTRRTSTVRLLASERAAAEPPTRRVEGAEMVQRPLGP
ncbi:MAG: hypothetical protein ABIX10_11955 [Acidimicrobiales bacterium]